MTLSQAVEMAQQVQKRLRVCKWVCVCFFFWGGDPFWPRFLQEKYQERRNPFWGSNKDEPWQVPFGKRGPCPEL